MINFTFCSPTLFRVGRDVENEAGQILKDMGAKCVMMQYGGGSVKKSGLYDRVVKSISDAGIKLVEMGGVEPNPRLSFVREAIEMGKKEGVDFLLAVGGGSVIDSCKATAVGLANTEFDVWDFYCGKQPSPAKVLPVGTVLTIPAAGSEGSNSSVITNTDNQMKRGLSCQATRPRFSLLNPELCFTLPQNQMANGVADILAHIIERYMTNTPDVDLTDRLCEAVMTGVIKAAKQLQKNYNDYEAWAELLWASTLAHTDALGVGRQQDWASHQLEHELSGVYDVPHGAGLAVVMPAWMRYVMKCNVARFCRFAVEVMGCEPDPFYPERLAVEGIDRYEAFLKSLGLPTRLSELEIDDKNLRMMADNCKKSNGDGTVGNFKRLNADDCYNIYKSAL